MTEKTKDSQNIHSGHRERMREKLKKGGPSVLEDHELLEMLLYNLYPRKDTNAAAHKLLNEFGGSLELLLNADPADLERRCSLRGNSAVLFNIIAEMGKRSVYGKFKTGMKIDSSDLAGILAKSLLAHEKRECFYVICLDAQSRLISSALISLGSVNETHVYIRNIAEAALKFGAASIILTHNHPGGTLTPSTEDIVTTANVARAMAMIDVILADHIIVCGNEYMSMKDAEII